MRILLCIHHRLDPRAGAARATLGLAEALVRSGCSVDVLSYDDVYAPGPETKWRNLAFPWRAAARLARVGGRYDVIDASTGDTWVWAQLGRPRSHRVAVVTRSHGLEQVAYEAERAWSRKAGSRDSVRHLAYGAYRRWEVGRSLALADHVIVLNRIDEEYLTRRLAVPRDRVSVIPNGVADGIGPGAPAVDDGPLRIAFIGSWLRRKGKTALVTVAEELDRRGTDFALSLLGTGEHAEVVLADFPAALRHRLHVTERFEPGELPSLLAGHHVLLSPSLAEGFSLSIVEAMSRGLVPIATGVGGAPEVIDHLVDGVLVPVDDPVAMVDAVQTLDRDRTALRRMALRSQQAADRYRWPAIAASTRLVYESAIERRCHPTR